VTYQEGEEEEEEEEEVESEECFTTTLRTVKTMTMTKQRCFDSTEEKSSRMMIREENRRLFVFSERH
jgi:hypothetical protein